MKFRKERLGKLIREELNEIVLRTLEFPGAVVSIISVELTDELDHATVRYSVFPNDKGPEVMRVFAARGGELRRALMKKVHLKSMPLFTYKLDLGNENAARVEKLLLDQ